MANTSSIDKTTIHDVLERMNSQLDQKYAGKSRSVYLNYLWGSVTSDAISTVVFGIAKGHVECNDFKSSFTDAMDRLVDLSGWTTYFPWLFNAVA